MNGWSPCTLITAVCSATGMESAQARAIRASATEAMRSLPELQLSDVINTGKPQSVASCCNCSLSVQRTTASTPAASLLRSSTRWIIGLPPMSASTLLGSRDDCSRAGTATTAFSINPLLIRSISPKASSHRPER